MALLTTILVMAVLLVAGTLAWWVAGRYTVAPSERTPLRQLGAGGVIATMRRGADQYAMMPY